MGFALNGQSWTASTQIAGTDDINVIKSITDVDENTIILGEYFGEIDLGGSTLPSNGMRDYFILKFDNNGALDWATNIGGPQNEFVYGGIGTDLAGNVYVSGAFMNKAFFTPSDSVEGMMQDIFLAKYTADGDVDWYKNAGTGGKAQRPSSLTINEAGNINLAGTFMDSIKFDETTTLYSEKAVSNYFYSEFDSDGNLVWAKQIISNSISSPGTVFDVQANSSHITMTGIYADSTFIEDKVLVSDSLYDVHVIRTNLTGDLDWVRSIGGKGYVYSYNMAFDDDENVYVSGYYYAPSLIIDSTETDQVIVEGNAGSYDFFVVKYNSEGTYQWARTSGGPDIDKLYDIEYYEGEITVCGYFTDSISWGGRSLKAEGDGRDSDMFTGALDLDGNYRSANRFGGQDNSHEEAFSISTTSDKKYNVIRSNSSILQLGNDIYSSSNGKYYLVFGVVGCRTISVDFVIPTDVNTCYGDSTGTIQISASGGFGSPWQYSIDNGETYQTDLTLFTDVPAGVYQAVVIDSEGCAQAAGSTVSVNQPDELIAEVVEYDEGGPSYEDKPYIVVAASGGNSPYVYTLLPDSIPQLIGTFTLDFGSNYTVAVDDRNGCGPAATDTIMTSDGPCPTITIEIINTSDVPTGGTGHIEVVASGGASPYTYTLTPGDVDTTTADTILFEISSSGTYTIEVVDNANCGPASTGDIIILGTSNYTYAEANVYPNPTKGEITIEMATESSQNTIELMSMTGQLLRSKIVYSSGGQISETLNLGEFAKGMYILRIDGKVLKSAIVLQ